jgi:hypothetical protein
VRLWRETGPASEAPNETSFLAFKRNAPTASRLVAVSLIVFRGGEAERQSGMRARGPETDGGQMELPPLARFREQFANLDMFEALKHAQGPVSAPCLFPAQAPAVENLRRLFGEELGREVGEL